MIHTREHRRIVRGMTWSVYHATPRARVTLARRRRRPILVRNRRLRRTARVPSLRAHGVSNVTCRRLTRVNMFSFRITGSASERNDRLGPVVATSFPFARAESTERVTVFDANWRVLPNASFEHFSPISTRNAVPLEDAGPTIMLDTCDGLRPNQGANRMLRNRALATLDAP